MPLRLIEIGKRALLTHRAAMEVVGHNTANVETPGYVRQRPVMAAIPGAVSGHGGGGVLMIDIVRMRDEFLATQLTYERGWVGQDRALRASLGQVEHVFTGVSQGGLAMVIEQMFDAWGDLGLDPTGPAAREQVIQRAQIAAETISDRWNQLNELRFEIDHRLSDTVDRANALAAEIAQINGKIGSAAEPSGRNDLMSKREALLAELSELCGAEGVEGENGMMDVVIGGRRMVQDNAVIELEIVPDPLQPGMHLVALGVAVSPEGLRGELAGRLEARDTYIPEYMTRLDELAQELADELNLLHNAGFDLDGNAGGDFFAYDPTRPAASLTVTAAIIADSRLIAAAATGPPNFSTGDGVNAMAIEDLRNTRILGGDLYTTSEFTAELIAQVGIDAAAAETRLEGRELLVDNLYGAYVSESGVSLDEEALDLIRYQQAYLAASRVISTAIAVMDDILALK